MSLRDRCHLSVVRSLNLHVLLYLEAERDPDWIFLRQAKRGTCCTHILRIMFFASRPCYYNPTSGSQLTSAFAAYLPQVRRERALDGLMEDGSRAGGDDDDTADGSNRRQGAELDEEDDEEETKCKAAIEVEKRVYKGSFQVQPCERWSGVVSRR